MTGRIATVIVIGALTTAVAARQTQQPRDDTPLPDVTFTVDVNYVEVDAMVTDAAGMPVTNLTAADFELLEDGQPQAVSAFSFVNVPIVRPERQRFASGPIDEITVYAEVYENEVLPRHMVELRTRARAEGGQIAFSLTDQLWSRDGPDRGAYSHWARIPVSDLAPGDYVLELEARSLVEPMRVVKRELEIRVRE